MCISHVVHSHFITTDIISITHVHKKKTTLEKNKITGICVGIVYKVNFKLYFIYLRIKKNNLIS